MNELEKKVFELVSGRDFDLATIIAEENGYDLEDFYEIDVKISKIVSSFIVGEIREAYETGHNNGGVDSTNFNSGYPSKEITSSEYLKSKYNINPEEK